MHLSLLTLPGETMDSAINRYNQSSSDNPDFLKFTTATHRDYSLWEEVAKDHPLVHKDTQKPNGETCDVGIIAVVPLLTLSSFGDEICGSMIGDVTDPTSIQVASKSTATEEFVRLWRLKGAAPNVELQLYDVQPLPPLSDTNLEQRSHGFASPGSTTQEQDADELSRPPACDAASGLSDHTHDTLEKTSTQTWMSEHAFQAGYTPLAGVRFGGEEYSLRGPIPYDKDTWVCSPPRVFFRLTIGAEEWREAVPVQRDDGQLLMWMVERVACSGGMSLFWPAFVIVDDTLSRIADLISDRCYFVVAHSALSGIHLGRRRRAKAHTLPFSLERHVSAFPSTQISPKKHQCRHLQVY